MGTITGLTAARMQEIIDEQVVSAEIISDRLIFTRRDGSTFDAGDVAAATPPPNPAVLLTKATTQSIPNNVHTSISFTTEIVDTNVMHDPAVNNTRITIKTAGIYQIESNILWAGFNGGYRNLKVLKNGLDVVLQERKIFASSVSVFQTLSGLLSLAVDDYLELQAFQQSGGAINIEADGVGYPLFSAVKTPD